MVPSAYVDMVPHHVWDVLCFVMSMILHSPIDNEPIPGHSTTLHDRFNHDKPRTTFGLNLIPFISEVHLNTKS